MKMNSVNFNDIVDSLKLNIDQNIFELCFNLRCSDGVIYRRLISKGFRGISPLKDAIKKGEL